MKNLKILAISFCIVCLFCSFDCRNSDKKNNAIEVTDWQEALKGNVAVYVEAHNKDEYFGEGDFGDIVLFNIDSRKKFYITRDSFVDEQPALSPDRSHVIFSTARIGNPAVLKVRGLGGPRELFKYDFQTNKLHWFAKNIQKKYRHDMYDFSNLHFSPEGKTIYFYGSKKVFQVSLVDSVLSTILSLGENDLVFSMALSPDGKKLGINYISHGLERIDILDLENNSTKNLVNRIGGGGLGLSWSTDGRSLLYSLFSSRKYTWLEYNSEIDKSDTLDFPGLDSTIVISYAYYIDKTNLLLLGGNAIHPSDSTREPYAKNDELIKFNLVTKEYEWLTDDGYAKGDVQVYPSLIK
jgi:hypothetical protein